MVAPLFNRPLEEITPPLLFQQSSPLEKRNGYATIAGLFDDT